MAVRADTTHADSVFQDLLKKLKDARPFFNGPFDQDVRERLEQMFETRGTSAGQFWPDLAPATIAHKARYRRANMGILRFSNRLWASLVKRTGPDVVLNVGAQQYERGSSLPYAGVHQGPTEHRPARPVIPDPVPSSWVDAWEDLTVAYLERDA